jgi:hypothetical protein
LLIVSCAIAETGVVKICAVSPGQIWPALNFVWGACFGF